MRSAGKGSINLMGSDGLFDDAFASLSGVYASSFPTSGSHPIVKAFKKAHGGDAEFFGAPSYVAAQVVGGAIDRACKDGKATRAEVRAQVRKTNLKKTLLGFNVKFNSVGDIAGGQFGIWKSNGTALRPSRLVVKVNSDGRAAHLRGGPHAFCARVSGVELESLLGSDRQRPDARERLLADRPGLLDGLRDPQAPELRPRRRLHGRRLHRLLRAPGGSAGLFIRARLSGSSCR